MQQQAEAGQFLRDIVYGVNDALVTNIGIVAGFTVSLQQKHLIFLAALIDLSISSFSMGSGTYLSRTSELAFLSKRMGAAKEEEVASAEGSPITAALIMWFVYFASGSLPLIPFLFLNRPTSIAIASLSIAIVTFIALGAFKARMTDRSYLRGVVEFFVFGSISAAVGFAIGTLGERLVH